MRGFLAADRLTRALLTAWGYRYNAWSLRRFTAAKRYSIILAFLQTALAETIDAVIDVQDKLITRIHNRARERRERLLRTSEQARTRAILVLEGIGTLVVDAAIPDDKLRVQIFAKWPSEELAEMVAECRKLRERDDGSYLSFLVPWFGYLENIRPFS